MMKKLREHWYFGLIIIPILINYFTDLIDIATILDDWKITLISILIISLFILSYKYYQLKKDRGFYHLSEHDIKTIHELLEIIDIEDFQKNICRVDSWYGYPQDSIHDIGEFIDEAQLLTNKTSNKKLNTLIKNFVDVLIEFDSRSSQSLYGDGEGKRYVPPKDFDYNTNFENFKENREYLNQKSSEALEKLEKIMTFLKQGGYM